MPDLREHPDNSLGIFVLIDTYLLGAGWTIRGPEDEHEEVNYGDSVYVHPKNGRAGGWLDAIGWQADIESEVGS